MRESSKGRKKYRNVDRTLELNGLKIFIVGGVSIKNRERWRLSEVANNYTNISTMARSK